MPWFGYAAEALWIFVQCYLTWRLLDTIEEERFSHRITMSVLLVLSLCIAALEMYDVTAYNVIASSGTLTLYSILFASASIILYKNKNRVIPKIQTCILVWEFTRLTDYFIQTILYGILKNDTIDSRLFQITSLPRAILLLLYSILWIIICRFICNAYKKYISDSWLMRWPGIIFSISFWWLLSVLQRVYYKPKEMVDEGYLFIWLLLIFGVTVFSLSFWILHRRWRLQEENRLQRLQLGFMEKKHEQLLEQYQERRQMVHDTKNNYLTLKHYINQEDLTGAKQYLDSLIPENTDIGIYRWSSHEILDMIFSIKADAAKNAGIECRIFSDDLSQIKLTDVEISSLFGNLLDNAIEAQKGKENIPEKWIEVKVKRNQDTLYISIQNPYEGIIQFEDGKPKSSKKNKEEHGIGGLLIRRIIRRYDGLVKINTERQVFSVSIMMNAF